MESTGNVTSFHNKLSEAQNKWLFFNFFIKYSFLSNRFVSSEAWQEAGVFVCACVCALAFWASGLVNTAAVEWK